MSFISPLRVFLFVGTVGSAIGALLGLLVLLNDEVRAKLMADDMVKPVLMGAWRQPGTFEPHYTVFNKMPLPVVISHFIAAFVWMLCVPFQLYPRLRHNYKRVHRAIGYVFMTSGMVLVISGYGMILSKMYTSSFQESVLNLRSAFTLFGVAVSCALTAALSNARAKDFDQHRAWIVRAICLGMTGFYARIISVGPLNAHGYQWLTRTKVLPAVGTDEAALLERLVFGYAEWIAFALMVILAEIWVIPQFKDKKPLENKAQLNSSKA
ncbi:hypothetical protein MIR68_007199 [Amoeboaphelidium protococcarum]|nr:hypothetical protein MIR68_007199 [Amoeboaphelidium protococcarum]